MGQPRSGDEIKVWLTDYLANLLDLSADEIDPTVNFDEYGLDSALAISLTGDLEDWLGAKIKPTLLYNYTTIQTLSENIAEDLSAASSSPSLSESP